MVSKILKVYKGTEVVATTEFHDGDEQYYPYGLLEVDIDNLPINTTIPEGTYEGVLEINGIESERVKVPEFTTHYVKPKYINLVEESNVIEMVVGKYRDIMYGLEPRHTTRPCNVVVADPDIISIASYEGYPFGMEYPFGMDALKIGTTEITITHVDLPDQIIKLTINVIEEDRGNS
ncbi:hypothetical protein J3T65_05225 [Staphylococcus simiae]|uniref:hypothetical protein n=1 Tax=Staphylococcus simiae TaxID=308354 RepID=UPI001A97BE63|nr:hypothetical protein [Staphylococcus simiae]MBO1199113.1 hypothetical protein [Staphylococcus simiae]MBO1201179.1 hypothetical protein [Staphylococcus simiae]MBO1203327.1 hypothetical protein [Staphylococcus simiae]MBO1210855.1 hypothetical protein [Staphylococcus simiae]MBO1229551.1 hypothetical protein [Staphylococcus simiae]